MSFLGRCSFLSVIHFFFLCGVAGLSSTMFAQDDEKPDSKAEELTPQSKTVITMIKSGVSFLRKSQHHRGDFGNAALVGLAIYNGERSLGKSKAELRKDPDLIKIAARVDKESRLADPKSERTIYALCTATIFLTELDADKYKKTIESGVKFLVDRQMEHGGWGYRREVYGDTSQTQFACMTFWIARKYGIDVPEKNLISAAKFLVATQQDDGGFVYKAKPGTAYGQTTHSLTAAGLGALYVVADSLGLGEPVREKVLFSPGGPLPPDVSLTDKKPKRKIKINADLKSMINGSKSRGRKWFPEHFVENPSNWTYYFLYSYERLESFKTNFKKDGILQAPSWYVRGAKFLKEQQNDDGSWMSTNSVEQSKDHSTAFAILFLSRATTLLVPKEAVDVVETVHSGGSGGTSMFLPKKVDVNLLDRVDIKKIASDRQVIDWKNYRDSTEIIIEKLLASSPKIRGSVIKQLVEHEEPAARLVAVKAMAKSRSVDYAQFLIYALSDPDAKIVRHASRGLRLVSRKADAPRLSKGKLQEKEIKNQIEYWKAWHKGLE